MRSLGNLLELFPATRSAGLTNAEVAVSRSRFGLNRLTPLPRIPFWKQFLAKFDEPIIRILLGASILKIVVDLFEAAPVLGASGLVAVVLTWVGVVILDRRDWLASVFFGLAGVLVGVSVVVGHPSFEGLAVMVAVALATGVSFLSEYRSDREFDRLNGHKESIRAKVMRGGLATTTMLEDVVVGDLILLEAGDEIPADGRIVEVNDLLVDQSLMTGESEPVVKEAAGDKDKDDEPGSVYRGTQVVGGLGRMVVTNVGDDTMLGQIARRLHGHSDDTTPDVAQPADSIARVQEKLTISKEQTPLQLKLTALAGLISRVGYLAAGLIFLALLARGLFFTTPAEVFWPTAYPDILTVSRNLLGYVVYMVIVIVVAVPEGLPMSVTVSLALAMRQMTRANALVRRLVATETIGSATVICTDKTGTLTQNRMTVVRVGVDGQIFETAAVEVRKNLAEAELNAVDWLANNAALNSTASIEEREGRSRVIGSSTEGALLLWLNQFNVDVVAYRRVFRPLHRVAFSSLQKTMTTVVERNAEPVLFVKGAPETVLTRCRSIAEADGKLRPLTDTDRAAIGSQMKELAGQAMRTLAFAHATLPKHLLDTPDAIAAFVGTGDYDLVFDGFVGIQDPVRAEVPSAMGACRSAGIAVVMITGDTVETAQAVATEVGLLHDPASIVMTSTEFESMTDDELRPMLSRLRVLARAKPLDKYRLVRLHQERGEVVAMTGDGTNDAPSLRKADVGLAMGIAGTEVAKEASQIVLLDDSFGTIVKAVHWGRALYENIQRFIQFQLTINVSALLIAFLGPFLGLKPPFTVLQLLWINVIMDTFAAIALCSEPPRAGLMKDRPKRRDENIVTRAMFRNVAITAGFYVVVMIGLLQGMAHAEWFTGEARSLAFPELTVRQVTIFFTVYVVFQLWNQINCRSLTPESSGLRGIFRNPLFWVISLVTLIVQVLIVSFGGRLFEVEPLSVIDWLMIVGCTSSVLVFAEVARLIRVAFKKRG